MKKQKLIIIVGPTSSGKTSLSIAVAKRFNGEVISADSRQVYRGMDLGSGKVTVEEMDDIPHHLLDIADPKDVYTADQFRVDATGAIEDITSRGKVPVIAGGTFFYIDVLLGKISTPQVSPNEALREELEGKDTMELFKILKEKDPRRAETIDQYNKVRLIRALEIVDALGSVPKEIKETPYDTLTIGIDVPKEELHHNIHVRLLERIEQGMIEEVARLHEEGVSWERLEDLGLEYRYVAQYLQEEISKEEMLRILESEIRKFAKRQMTWLKRDKEIRWFKKGDPQILKEIQKFL
ncbi:tRNA (adenosine(37)-N6)-dimethylallyltransferase MiaA [Candidatus Kaiserbacteria bacterium]|nr:tRNA (adenosine(37)-N6)-dimethylallyltransferase MiaA [Candidatus Kaiserbacteria bacterium]